MPLLGIGNAASGGKKPSTPTIGTATAGNAQATVAFTASTYLGKTGSVTYRATSTPGGITATGSVSPITVTGLSNGTAYTFTVRAEAPYGVNSDESTASNSVTPVAPPSFPPPPPSFPPPPPSFPPPPPSFPPPPPSFPPPPPSFPPPPPSFPPPPPSFPPPPPSFPPPQTRICTSFCEAQFYCSPGEIGACIVMDFCFNSDC